TALAGPGLVMALTMSEEVFGMIPGVRARLRSPGAQLSDGEVGFVAVRRCLRVGGLLVLLDVPTSSVALAIAQITKEKNKVFLASGPAASDLTGPKCSPNTVHWTYDTYALAHTTGKAEVDAGGKTWFFLTADYAFGAALERDTTAVVKEAGGTIV